MNREEKKEASNNNFSKGASSQNVGGAADPKVTIPDNISGLSIKEMKNLLDKLGVKRDDCFEKEDLINRLKETKNNKGKPPPSSSGTR